MSDSPQNDPMRHSESQPEHEQDLTRVAGYEAGHLMQTLSIRGLKLFVLGFLGTVALLLLLVYAAYIWFRPAVDMPPRYGPAYAGHELAPELAADQHWVNPQISRRKVDRRQLRRISDYQWISREKGLLQIPIEQAMELMVGRGFDLEGGRTLVNPGPKREAHTQQEQEEAAP